MDKDSGRGPDEQRAEWTTAYINDLPDSAFAYVESGDKDEDGKTTPRSKRHFPHHDTGGAIDLAHLRNALARAPQSPFGDKAMPHLERHAKAEGIGDRSMNYERRYLIAEELRVIETAQGNQISWYPALFNSLSVDMLGIREIIKPSAFNKTIQEADVRALFNHNPDYVLGRNTVGTLDLSIDRKGLRAAATPPETQWASDLMESIKRRDISGGSFGFQAIKDTWKEQEDNSLLRELHEVKLFDVSIVTYPAYPETNGSIALRSAMLANGINDERFTRALLKRQAGLPLDQEDCAELRNVQLLIPEPDTHSVLNRKTKLRDMDLVLLRLRR